MNDIKKNVLIKLNKRLSDKRFLYKRLAYRLWYMLKIAIRFRSGEALIYMGKIILYLNKEWRKKYGYEECLKMCHSTVELVVNILKRSKVDVTAVILLGSYAKGRCNAYSDIDLLVLVSTNSDKIALSKIEKIIVKKFPLIAMDIFTLKEFKTLASQLDPIFLDTIYYGKVYFATPEFFILINDLKFSTLKKLDEQVQQKIVKILEFL